MATRALDLLDRRILAAVAFVDALGRPVTCPIRVAGPPGFKHFFKRKGLMIVTSAPGLEEHGRSFESPPVAPAIGSLRVALDIDPADSSFAKRRISLRLPRDPDPNQNDSLFSPAVVVVPPGPAARTSGLAASLRATVSRSDDGRLIEGAIVRLRPDGARPETVALTNAAGEALLLADAIPLATPGPGAVMAGDFAARLDAFVNPASVRFNAPTALMEARAAERARQDGYPDPDGRVGPATPVLNVRIAAGEERVAVIAWVPP